MIARSVNPKNSTTFWGRLQDTLFPSKYGGNMLGIGSGSFDPENPRNPGNRLR
jgi:hypothetical protein